VASHALTELDEAMLDVARVLFILQVFADSFVGELAPKPGVPPEEEGMRTISQAVTKNSVRLRGTFVMRRRRRLRRGVFLSKF